ncbi:hypothetical protein ACH4L5_36570 [Streptomyces sp. NPDC017405]|uniref:hypothetical protein n=1 Tax=unclassified Streptomyces TaxID=2593676 RepID=UPI0037B6468B
MVRLEQLRKQAAAHTELAALWADSVGTRRAPERTGHVQAVGFDADAGHLDIAPDAPTFGTKLHWSAPKLVAAATRRGTARTSARSTS